MQIDLREVQVCGYVGHQNKVALAEGVQVSVSHIQEVTPHVLYHL
jgi:hypothetical protein